MPPNTPGTAVALPADVRADLLRAQAGQISTNQPLPRVKVMAAGAGLFEFSETNDTVRSFSGIILHTHPRNVLWDKAYGLGEPDENGKSEGPACRSNDGRFGVPREGFIHLGLSQNRGQTRESATYEARGDEQIECATCPYNQWNSKGLLGRGEGRGKATTNQKSIYIMLPDMEMPVELTLPPTSIRNFDAYLASLLNRGDPVQSVLTQFAQKVEQKGQLKWAVVTFVAERALNGDEFTLAMERRTRYMRQMAPEMAVQDAEVVDSGEELSDQEPVAGETEELPF